MKSAFERALDYTFGNEGGFSNEKFDAGGATKFGITIHDLARWRHRAVSVQEVKDLKLEDAMSIYEAWYWKPLACPDIKYPGVAIAMFDIGVVRGIGVPPIYAQQICNAHGAKLTVDGHIGPKTLAVINATDPKLFVNDFADKARNGFLAIVVRKPTQARFIKGWLNRAKRLRTLA